MPRNKKRKKDRDVIELKCEFSECQDVCHGMQDLNSHVKQHLDQMRLKLTAAIINVQEVDVDRTKCECPWTECHVILDITDWESSSLHVNYHAFHTFLKRIGDEELEWRGVPMACMRDQSQRNAIPDLSSLMCQWSSCAQLSDNPWLFYQHVAGHASDDCSKSASGKRKVRKCMWGSCDYSTTGAVTKLVDHLRTHTNERRYACSKCGAFYSQSTRLEDHMKRQAVGVKTFQCSHCNKQCSTERLLRDHLRKHINMYGCMFCEMTCPSPSALRIHILYRHSTERPFTCSVCEKRFKTKFDLSTHQIIHEYAGHVFECTEENCDYTSKSMSSVERHLNEGHSEIRVYGCHLCEDVHINGRDLSCHLKNDHQLKYPSGHVKFRFVRESDGVYRLVTVRYECSQEGDESDVEEPEFEITDVVGDVTGDKMEPEPEHYVDEESNELVEQLFT